MMELIDDPQRNCPFPLPPSSGVTYKWCDSDLCGRLSSSTLVISDPNVLYLPFSAVLDGLDSSPDLACLPFSTSLLFFCDSFFLQVLGDFAMPGVLDDLLDWSILLRAFARSAVAFCCWILFLDGLPSVLILDELAESLISVLAICTGVGLCVLYWNCVCVHLGGFPF